MKPLVLVCAILLLTMGVKAQEKEADIYLVKSGYVEYELSGSITGTRTIWWDNYGRWTREEEKSLTKMKVFGFTSEEETHTITVTKDDRFWTANMLEQTGMTGIEPVEDIQLELSEMDEEDKEELGRELFDALGGRELPPETFLGRKCQVLEVMGAKTYIYNNIPLKSSVDIMGIRADVTAKELRENITVPKSKFEPVSGIDYREMPDEFGFFE